MHPLHFASCFTSSAAASRCNVGSQTNVWGSYQRTTKNNDTKKLSNDLKALRSVIIVRPSGWKLRLYLLHPIEKCLDGDRVGSLGGLEAAVDGGRGGAESLSFAEKQRNLRHFPKKRRQGLSRNGGRRKNGRRRGRNRSRTHLIEQVSA